MEENEEVIPDTIADQLAKMVLATLASFIAQRAVEVGYNSLIKNRRKK